MTTVTANQERVSLIPLTTTGVVTTILGLLTLVGVVTGLGRLLLGMGSTTTLTDAVPWGIWIGFDFVMIAFSGAGFTLAAITHVFHMEKYQPAARPAILAGFLGYTSVLLLLVLDLGRPDRFYNFMLYWNIHSPLFEISCCILLYTTVLMLENSTLLLERLPWKLPLHLLHRAMVPIAIIGVTLSSLHQSTLGTLYLNMPYRLDALWYTPMLPPLFFVSSVMAGLGLAMIAYATAARITDREIQPGILNGLATIIAWTTLLYLAMKVGDLVVRGQLAAFLSFDAMSQLMWVEIGLCAAVPLVMLFVPAVRNHSLGRWTAIALVMLGVLFNRFSATMFAQTSPVAGATYVPHILEWLSTLGILAGCALVWYFGVRYLTLFEDKVHHE